MSTTPWSDNECYQAILSRDGRFDGEFFVGVTSTGIYCRPVCPAKKPKFENCVFVGSAAAAEELGYRPCHRCRPETAPGSPAWLGTESTVARALRLLSESAGDGASIEQLSDRLGITDRHLRRLFNEQLGAGPKAVAQTERFHLARQLLVHTDMGMSQVAFSSGFQSVRRFNDAVKRAFGTTPSQYRTKARGLGNAGVSPHVRLWLGYRAPLRWEDLVTYLSRRAIPGVEWIARGSYTRTVTLDGARGLLRVKPSPSGHTARRQIQVDLALDRPIQLGSAVRRIRDLLDLDAATSVAERHLAGDPKLAPLVKARPGLRVPGCWDVFELAVRTVIGQQVTVQGAVTLLTRLVESFGTTLPPEEASSLGPLPGPSDVAIVFPPAERLAEADLSRIGLTGARRRTVVELAEAFARDPHFVDGSTAMSEAIARLRDIRGIGAWTAEYIALRALRHPDAFPAADLGLLKAAGLTRSADLAALADAWRPWRGYAALHLWTALAEDTTTHD